MIYAIHNTTKEHSLVTWQRSDWDYDWRIVEADADGWIPWHGGECPLPGMTRCDVKFRDKSMSAVGAGGLLWGHIIAYRPILDAKPGIDVTRLVSERHAPEWNGEGLPPVGCDVDVVCVDDKHHIVEIVAHDGDRVIYREPTSICIEYDWRPASAFRPIRSEEDKEIDRIKDIIADEFDADRRDCYLAARALYRAGYRKHDD